METINNLLSLPIVKAAVDKATDAYNKLKSSSSLVKDGVEKVEAVANEVKVSLSPITKELEGPVRVLDNFVCKSLVIIEKRLPVLKEQPEVMYGAFKDYIKDTLTPNVKVVLRIVCQCEKKLSPVAGFALTQANRMAVVVDFFARSAEKVVDYFFAKKTEKCVSNGYAEEPEPESGSSTKSDVEDEPLPKVVQTAETLGRVGFKLARAGFMVSTTPLRWTLSLFTCRKGAARTRESSHVVKSAGSSGSSGASSMSSTSPEGARSVSPSSSEGYIAHV